MGTAYSARQSSYAQGDTINSDDTNDEFDAILNSLEQAVIHMTVLLVKVVLFQNF